MELKDYSGTFKPDLKLDDFSKDVLLNAWIETSKLYLLLDGCWDDLIKERYGEQKFLELESEIWFRVLPHDYRRMTKVFNIRGDSIATLFKYLQVAPLIAVIYPMQFELENKNRGIFTVTRCPTLEYFERHNQPSKIKLFCEQGGLDHRIFQMLAHYSDANIKVSPLKLPPRKSKDETPACQWECKLERKA